MTTSKKCPHCKGTGKGVGYFGFDVSLQKRITHDNNVFNALVAAVMMGFTIFFTIRLPVWGALLHSQPTLAECLNYSMFVGCWTGLISWWYFVTFTAVSSDAPLVVKVPRDEPKNDIPQDRVHRLELVTRNRVGGKWSFIDMPVSDYKLREIAVNVLMTGGAFSRPYLCDRRRVISQYKYHKLRATLLKYGILESTGTVTNVTPVGRAMFRYYANLNIRSLEQRSEI